MNDADLVNGFSLVDYDVHKSYAKGAEDAHVATYGIIYKHLGGVALRWTESVFMVRKGFMNAVNIAFVKINADLKKAGLPEVDFNVTPVADAALELMEKRARRSLNDQVREIGAGLVKRIEKLEAKFNEATDDVNAFLYKGRLAIARAKRELERARGLALAFLIEADAADAIAATKALIDAEQVKRDLTKAEAKVAEAKAKAEGLAAPAVAPEAELIEVEELEG